MSWDVMTNEITCGVTWPRHYNTKPHSSIVGNQSSYIILLRNLLAAILFVEKLTSHYHICWEALFLSSYHLLICWETTFLDLIRWRSKSLLITLRLRANNLVIIQINPSQVSSFIWSLKPLEPPCGWGKYGLLDVTSTASLCSIALVAAM